MMTIKDKLKKGQVLSAKKCTMYKPKHLYKTVYKMKKEGYTFLCYYLGNSNHKMFELDLKRTPKRLMK